MFIAKTTTNKHGDLIALAKNKNGAKQLILNKWNSCEKQISEKQPDVNLEIYNDYDQLDKKHPIIISEIGLNQCITL